jgi:hypothetical protein
MESTSRRKGGTCTSRAGAAKLAEKRGALLVALEAGATIGEASKDCGVGRSSFHRWLKADHYLQDAMLLAKARARWRRLNGLQ